MLALHTIYNTGVFLPPLILVLSMVLGGLFACHFFDTIRLPISCVVLEILP